MNRPDVMLAVLATVPSSALARACAEIILLPEAQGTLAVTTLSCQFSPRSQLASLCPGTLTPPESSGPGAHCTTGSISP